MTIEYTQPGDVAAQIYNESRRTGRTHEEAAKDAWNAINCIKDTANKEQTSTSKSS